MVTDKELLTILDAKKSFILYDFDPAESSDFTDPYEFYYVIHLVNQENIKCHIIETGKTLYGTRKLFEFIKENKKTFVFLGDL